MSGNNVNRKNAQNTFDELLSLGVIPIVNENDSISTYELQNLEKFGDNDTLSAMVAALVRADLLILLSDIDGLFTDDPNTNPDAKFIDVVENLDDNLLNMGKGTSGSKVGTGGMATKLTAAQIASAAGVDMVIANGADFHIIHKITEGRRYGIPRILPPTVARKAYSRYLDAIAYLPYPRAFIVPIWVLCSSTIRVMVVRLTSAATRKKITGKTCPILLILSALSP